MTRQDSNLQFPAQRERWNMGMTPAGLEPAIPGSVGRCLTHWATGPADLCCIIIVKKTAPVPPPLCPVFSLSRMTVVAIEVVCRRHKRASVPRGEGERGDGWPLGLWWSSLPSMATRWPCGLMDKALVFGTKDCRFESCQGQASPRVVALWARAKAGAALVCVCVCQRASEWQGVAGCGRTAQRRGRRRPGVAASRANAA